MYYTRISKKEMQKRERITIIIILVMFIGLGIFYKTQYDKIEKNKQETKTETQEVKENEFDINAALMGLNFRE